jgi:hypothetical protein
VKIKLKSITEMPTEIFCLVWLFRCFPCSSVSEDHLMGLKIAVFWVSMLCRLAEVYQYFRGACFLYHRPDDGGSKHL